AAASATGFSSASAATRASAAVKPAAASRQPSKATIDGFRMVALPDSSGLRDLFCGNRNTSDAVYYPRDAECKKPRAWSQVVARILNPCVRKGPADTTHGLRLLASVPSSCLGPHASKLCFFAEREAPDVKRSFLRRVPKRELGNQGTRNLPAPGASTCHPHGR